MFTAYILGTITTVKYFLMFIPVFFIFVLPIIVDWLESYTDKKNTAFPILGLLVLLEFFAIIIPDGNTLAKMLAV